MRLYHLKTFFFFLFSKNILKCRSQDHVIPRSTIFNADLVLAAISGMVFVPVLKLSDIM